MIYDMTPTMTDCLVWTGARSKAGYGQKRIGRRVVYVHRIAYAEKIGVPLEALTVRVRHTCDNPPCYNPDHLIPGSHTDNMADMRERGRHPLAFVDGRCRKGHDLAEVGVYVRPDGNGRMCMGCQRNRQKKLHDRLQEQLADQYNDSRED